MIRLSLALVLASIPAAAGCSPRDKALPSFRCTRDDMPGTVKAVLRDGKIRWIGVHGEEHPITGEREEWRWSCVPDDGRTYPVDPD